MKMKKTGKTISKAFKKAINQRMIRNFLDLRETFLNLGKPEVIKDLPEKRSILKKKLLKSTMLKKFQRFCKLKKRIVQLKNLENVNRFLKLNESVDSLRQHNKEKEKRKRQERPKRDVSKSNKLRKHVHELHRKHQSKKRKQMDYKSFQKDKSLFLTMHLKTMLRALE